MAVRKLIHRIIVLAIVPVILSMIIFGSLSYSIFKEKLIQERIEVAESLIGLASEEIKNPLYFLELNKLNSIVQNIKKNPDVLSVYIMDSSGRVITDGTPENKLYNQILNDNLSKKSVQSNELLYEIKNDVLQVSAPAAINEKIGIVRIDFSLKELDQALISLFTLLVIVGIIIFIGAVAMDIIISGSISKPIIMLGNAAGEISKGNFDTRIEIKSDDEIGELAAAFNKMSQDLKKSNNEIISAKEYTDNIVRSMTDTLIVVSQDCIIQTVNPATCGLLGYSEKELIGQPIGKVLADEKESQFSGSICSGLIKRGFIVNVERIYLSKDSREIPVVFSASIMRDDDGKVQGIVCVAKDITERKQTEELLKERARAELYGFIVSALPVFASGVPSQVRNTLVKNFADRFEKNIRPRFEEEMKRLENSRSARSDSIENTQEVLDAYTSWLRGLFSNFGIQSRITSNGIRRTAEFLNCPWIGEAKGNPIFCFICRTIIIRSLIWTNLKGSADQSSSIADGSQTCRFDLMLMQK